MRPERAMNMDTLGYDQFEVKPRRPYAWLWRTALVLLFWLAIFYYVSPILNAVRLAKAVEIRETDRVAESIDFPALRKSIARQIVAEVVRTAPEEQRKAIANYGLMPANAWLNDLLNENAVTDILAGRVPQGLGETPEGLAALPPLSARTTGKLVDIWLKSGFVTLGEYRLALPSPPGADTTALRFAFDSFSWKLSGIDLPPNLLATAVKKWREAESFPKP